MANSLPIWKTEPALMVRLATAQNHPAHSGVDIMTFAGWCGDRAALVAHVERYEAYALEHNAAGRVAGRRVRSNQRREA